MTFLHRARPALSLLATVGCLSLLLADSGADACEDTRVDRTFDVFTTCGGEHNGRIRIDALLGGPPGDVSSNEGTTAFSIVSGDVLVSAVEVTGQCSDGDPVEIQNLLFDIYIKSSDTEASCSVDLRSGLGKDVTCTDSAGKACTAQLTEAK